MKTSTPAFSFGILWMSILCPILWMEKIIPAFLFCILWMSFCALFYGWKQAHHLSPFAFFGWASVPICLDEEKHTRFLFFHFMDEHLCPILWMKKCNPASNFAFYNLILWIENNHLSHYAFYGWASVHICWMKTVQPAFSFCILQMSISSWFYGWKKSNPDFSFCILWMSVCTYLLDENKQNGFFILHLVDECPGT